MSVPPTDGPETPPGVTETLTDLEDLLDRLNVPWTRAGAFAADEYRATHRFTTDADVLVEWRDGLIEGLEEIGLVSRVFRDEGEVHLIRAQRGGIAIDVIVAGTDYQLQAIARGLHGALTVEDVLVHKLIAWRPKDRDDIASILSTGRDFDRAYVDRWVHDWDVDDRWREAQTWA